MRIQLDDLCLLLIIRKYNSVNLIDCLESQSTSYWCRILLCFDYYYTWSFSGPPYKEHVVQHLFFFFFFCDLVLHFPHIIYVHMLLFFFLCIKVSRNIRTFVSIWSRCYIRERNLYIFLFSKWKRRKFNEKRNRV